jgi:nickel/cobalt transporter (NicO) family protein
VTLTASFLHVLMGALVFVGLRFVVSQTPLMVARGSPFFLLTGYGLILLAGAIMLVQSLRLASTSAAHPHALAFGAGLLPCPLTISVLGFAWAQGAGPMVLVVLIALASGIAFTIGTVALLSIT